MRLRLWAAAVVTASLLTPTAATASDPHDCSTQGGVHGVCYNFGHRLFPKPTAHGYVNGCIDPVGSPYHWYVVLMMYGQGHWRVKFLQPVLAEHDFHSHEGQAEIHLYSNQEREHGATVKWGLRMVNDGNPPGKQWMFDVVQACVPDCGGRLEERIVDRIAHGVFGEDVPVVR